MSVTLLIGPTLSGGTSTVFASTGAYASGKASFSAPDSTRILPKTVDFLTKNPTPQGSNPGVARGGLKVSVANRVEDSDCCNVLPGTIIIEVDARWPLTQPEAILDEAISIFRAAVNSSTFVDSIKKGVLPL